MTYNHRWTRSILLGATALTGALTLSATQASAQERRYDFDVPAQPLNAALQTFARQAQLQVIFAEAETKSLRAPTLNGSYSADEALQVLLAGTQLKASRNSKGVLQVAVNTDPQSGSAAGDGADGTVQALIVTAQKREEDIQDVPIAISAFTQEDLTRSQVAGGPDLMTQVPNMTFTKTNFSSYSIQIRGIGTQAISATTDAAVAVAFNNTPFIRNRFFEQEFYDLQRVEVLRGPQGTLYGRNATAGVVNIISAKPSFQYEARLSGDVANYKSTRLEGMLNIPLVEDKVALRLAGAWTKRDGYVTNQITGNQIDGRDLWSTRLSLRVEPTDKISANLIWEHFQEDDDRLRSGKQLCHKDLKTKIGDLPMPPASDETWLGLGSINGTFSQGCAPASLYAPESFETPNGFALPYYQPLGLIGLPVVDGFDPYLSTTQSRDLRVIESTVDPHYRARSDLGELQVNLDLGEDLTLTSETAYSTDFVFSTQDYNRFNTAPGAFDVNDRTFQHRAGVFNRETGVFCDPQIGCADRVVAVDLSTAKSRQFSQELRLASDYDGPFNFSLGANFLRYDTEDKYYVFINTLGYVVAKAQFGNMPFVQSPYILNVSDNTDCLPAGRVPGDPTKIYEVQGCIYMDPNPIDSLNDQGHNYFLSKNPYKLISYAMFGEAYYNLTPTLKITGGLRWTVDKKSAPRIPSWLLVPDTYGYPVQEVVKQEWREPTGRLTVDWKPDLGFTDETLLYASYAHGYKAGGANPPPTTVTVAGALSNVGEDNLVESVAHPKTFDPEFVDAFEIGAKNTLLDGRLTLNTSAFYYDYKGYQISQIVDRSAVNMNFDAEVWGLEVEADWRPLENLRLGFKGGYENTHVADGMQAIDLMDRTAGHTDWVVAKPFPTIPSNCILPVWLVTYGGEIHGRPSLNEHGDPGWCADFYIGHIDSVTGLPYVPNPTETNGFLCTTEPSCHYYLYPGFDYRTAPNNGEGFFKDLSGNELPNAPHYTATLTADYTLPLPNDWLMTLHSDFYYQSEAWTRIFNMEGYDKLKAYTNVNFAAIFTNDDAGWKVMAYVKNVFDRDSITGAFLNSDDTGLTTNVFLTEPRLYGLRVTKEWTGMPWSLGPTPAPGEPYPFTLELGGSVQRHDAPYSAIAPSFLDNFSEGLDPLPAQGRDLDWGDGRELKLTYAPADSRWSASLGARFGKTNGSDQLIAREQTESGCTIKYYSCERLIAIGEDRYVKPYDYVATKIRQREDHAIVDFMIGSDVGLGAFAQGLKSQFGVGLRYARLESQTHASIYGIPEWQLPGEWVYVKYSQHHRYDADVTADRTFKGAGPTFSWDASKSLVGDDASGHLDIAWAVTAGVLFGKHKTAFSGHINDAYYDEKYFGEYRPIDPAPVRPATLTPIPLPASRSHSATVPVLDLSLGLSYEVQRFKVGAGYRWERYFDAIDGGYTEHKSYDRTIDGPYFKVAVGFGG